MLSDSFACAKNAVIGKWMRWLLLVVATILLCLPLPGYTQKVQRWNNNPVPAEEAMQHLLIHLHDGERIPFAKRVPKNGVQGHAIIFIRHEDIHATKILEHTIVVSHGDPPYWYSCQYCTSSS
jgi:hypothetical protein